MLFSSCRRFMTMGIGSSSLFIHLLILLVLDLFGSSNFVPATAANWHNLDSNFLPPKGLRRPTRLSNRDFDTSVRESPTNKRLSKFVIIHIGGVRLHVT
ncbi:hypothetical protein FBUS_01049 [Fasciolopsis buskii]|uniref:Uncharacterized protein n=1 Tax=Fasciolopsis buskii TaxID=27845 RepID=A0A8E0VKD5_9TREM|nr:hypothetical protein FBUS_01049 [Fasciolopsis buski]